MRRPFPDQVSQIRLTRLLHCLADLGRRTRCAQIGAGTESPAPAGQHDHPDGRVLFGSIDGSIKTGGDVGTPSVEALRAIEGDDCDAGARGLVEHRVFGTGSTVVAGHLPRHLLTPDYRIQPTLHPYCIPFSTAFHNLPCSLVKYGPNSEFPLVEARLRPCLAGADNTKSAVGRLDPRRGLHARKPGMFTASADESSNRRCYPAASLPPGRAEPRFCVWPSNSKKTDVRQRPGHMAWAWPFAGLT